jgi:hypothetical protein
VFPRTDWSQGGRNRSPGRGSARHARLPTRALDRRHHPPLARPAQDGRPRRGLERPALRHHGTRLSLLARQPQGSPTSESGARSPPSAP